MGHGLRLRGGAAIEEVKGARRFKVSLYYKLFLVYGVTFLGLFKIFGDSLTVSEDEEFSVIVLRLCVGAVLLLVNIVAVRALLRPLRSLSDFSGEFTDGKFGRRVEVSSNDEIGELAGAMNSMAERIQAQMESLKQIAIGVSHEVRTPLTRMRLATEMIQDAEIKQLIAGQIHELDTITAAILEREALNSGLVELKRHTFSLTDLLADLVQHYARSGQTISFSAPSAELSLTADRRRLEMCVKNLMDNAFVHGGGAGVRLHCGARDAEVVIVLENESHGAAAATKGFGLGLQLSESIARAHGGSLQFETVGGLTRATLSLPVSG